jgi:hypothetical protein
VLFLRVVDRHGPGPGQPTGVPVNPFWLVVWLVILAELAAWAVVLWVMAIRYLR